MNESLDHLAKVCEQLRKKEHTSYFAVMFTDPDWELCESARILARYIQTNGPKGKNAVYESHGRLITHDMINRFVLRYWEDNMYTGVMFQDHYPWDTEGLLIVRDVPKSDVRAVIEGTLGMTYYDIDAPGNPEGCTRVWLPPYEYVSAWKVDPTSAINATHSIVAGFFDYARIITKDEHPELLAPLVAVMQKDYFYASRVAADSINPANAHAQAGSTVRQYFNSALGYYDDRGGPEPSADEIMSIIHTLRKTFECHEDES